MQQDETHPMEEQAGRILADPVSQIACGACGIELDVSAVPSFDRIQCPQCGHELVVPARLGSFLLLHRIGTGGMGGVYYAHDEKLGRDVAIKVMLESLGKDPVFVETFRREAQTLAKLNHPNVVQIYSFGEEKGQPYIVMELVPGKRLDELMAAGRPLDQRLVVRIAEDIVSGLQAADEVGLIHGDIKPENIVLDEKFRAKLVDFGLAARVRQAGDTGVWGTPYYVAPERVRRKTVDARSDIYSLGATLFHALAGRPPFEGDTPAQVVRVRLEQPAPNVKDVRPDIHPIVASVVARMLEADPGMRYPTYASLLSDLRRASEALGGTTDDRTALGGTTRLRLVKKGAKNATGARPPSGKFVAPPASSPSATGKIVVRTGPQTEAVLEERKRAVLGTSLGESGKRRRKTSKVFVGIGLLLLAGLSLGAWGWHRHQTRQEEERRLALRRTLEARQREAVTVLAELQAGISNLLALASAPSGILPRLTNAIWIVTGQSLDSTQLAAPPKTAAGSPPSPAGPDASDAPGGSAIEGANVGVTPPPLSEPEHEVVRVAREAAQALQRLRDLASVLSETNRWAVQIAEQTRQAGSATGVSRKVGSLRMLRNGLESLEREIRILVQAAETGATRAEALAQHAARERERERRLREEEARRRAEEEARRRAEEERRARVAEELVRVETVRQQTAALIAKNRFEEAFQRVTRDVEGYQTEDGRAAIALLVDRYQYLKDLKAFLIEQLPKRPYPWGWTQDRSPEDVLGADAQGVRIRTRTVPWDQVSVPQMLRLIRHALAAPDVRVRVLAEQHLAAAIYCRENGGTEPALRFAAQAAELLPSLRETVARLIPESQRD